MNPLLGYRKFKSIKIPAWNNQKLSVLPKKYDDFIFNKLGANFSKLFGQSNFTHSARNEGLAHSTNDLKTYLGTYWPRSFIEAFNIMSDLLESPAIRSSFSTKTELNILDIGSGTGGDLLGIVESLDKEINSKFHYNIFSIDGNQNAIEIQKSLIEEFYPSSSPHYVVTNKDCINKKEFFSNLSKLLEQKQSEYDIILNFKFINEFYRGGGYDFNNGMYCDLLDILRLYLNKEGILILSDMTDKDGQNKPDVFFPLIMNREIHQFLIYHNKAFALLPILPISCSLAMNSCSCWGDCYKQKGFSICHSRSNSDKSKLNYFVFTTENNAKLILDHYKTKSAIDCSQNDIFRFESSISKGNPKEELPF